MQTSLFANIHLPPPNLLLGGADGKHWLSDKIGQFFPPDINIYYEPFIGGGAIFFAHCHRFKRAILADLNKELITTYRVIAERRGELCYQLLTMMTKI